MCTLLPCRLAEVLKQQVGSGQLRVEVDSVKVNPN